MGNKIPSSWFDDDPEWEMLQKKAANLPVPKELRQRIAAQKPKARMRREEPRAQAERQDTDKEVILSLKLAVPKIKPPDVKRIYSDNRRKIHSAGAGLIVVVAMFGVFKFMSGHSSGDKPDTPGTPQEQAEAVFNPLVPLENLKDAAGKQSRPEYRYDQERKVLAYVTQYNDVNLTISQQQAPENFKNNPSQLMSVANSIGASEPLETQKGTAFIGTDDKTGAQTAVFATDEALVFIRSTGDLDKESWKFYINQLSPSK